jgi:ketosteroid isomerase-like protein
MRAPELDTSHYDAKQRLAFAEICDVLRQMEELQAQGAPASVIGPALYDDALLCVGDGDARASRGLDIFLPGLHELLANAWGPCPHSEYLVQAPVIVSENTACMLIEFHTRPDHGRGAQQVYRAMYGWLRTPKGWRIQLEMYGQGSL